MSRRTRVQRSKRLQVVATMTKTVLASESEKDEGWRQFKTRMDVEYPGWDLDPLIVAKAKSVFGQEYNGAQHHGIVVLPNLS